MKREDKFGRLIYSSEVWREGLAQCNFFGRLDFFPRDEDFSIVLLRHSCYYSIAD